MLAGDEARRLGAALATAVELEWLADIRARLRERLQAARGEGGARQRSGRAGAGSLTNDAYIQVGPRPASLRFSPAGSQSRMKLMPPEGLPVIPVPQEVRFPGISRSRVSFYRPSPVP